MGIAPSGSRRRQRRDWGRANISARPGEGSGPRVPGTGSGGQRRGCCDLAPAAARLGTARFGCLRAATGQPLARGALSSAAPLGPRRPWQRLVRGSLPRVPASVGRLGHTAGLPAGRAERGLCSPPDPSLAGILCQVLVGE